MTPAPLLEWERRSIEEWRMRWRLPDVVAFAETGSTNDVAREMAESGAPAGVLVISEHQTAGRGRMQRPWSDRPGQSLLFSVILRPDSAGTGPLAPGTAPIRVGIALAGALRKAAGVDVRLKWPNDVVVHGRKLAGILCEASSIGGDTVVIAGIGINVHQQDDDWTHELRDHAVSIALARDGAAPPRCAVMDEVAAAMQDLFTQPLTPLAPREIGAFAAIDALRGVHVIASGPEPAEGLASGIDADGALLVDTDTGIRRIISGTVRAAPPAAHSAARTSR